MRAEDLSLSICLGSWNVLQHMIDIQIGHNTRIARVHEAVTNIHVSFRIAIADEYEVAANNNEIINRNTKFWS